MDGAVWKLFGGFLHMVEVEFVAFLCQVWVDYMGYHVFLAFDGHIVLLAGGDDKMTDLTDFMKLVCERVDALVLIGRAAARFYGAAVENGFPEERIYAAGYSMRKAVEIAHALAKEPGVVLLSPACASFDMYHNMAERGRDFKHLVHELEQQK